MVTSEFINQLIDDSLNVFIRGRAIDTRLNSIRTTQSEKINRPNGKEVLAPLSGKETSAKISVDF